MLHITGAFRETAGCKARMAGADGRSGTKGIAIYLFLCGGEGVDQIRGGQRLSISGTYVQRPWALGMEFP